LLEQPLEKDNISLTMLKHDLQCGDMAVPVGFAEFEVVGARPVDVFNTVMNVSAQPDWNSKASSVLLVGSWPEDGARGWDNAFNLIFDKKMEFLIWQVADADFENEEFWMATSTSNNDELRKLSPQRPDWIASDNCLGAYRIRKSPRGASVVVTQHVNTRLGIWFPFHQVLQVFPIAWEGMVLFIQALMKASVGQSSRKWAMNRTVAPSWMLPQPLHLARKAERNHSSASESPLAFDEHPMIQTSGAWRSLVIGVFAILGLGVCVGLIYCVRACNHSVRDYPASDAGSACTSTQGSFLSDVDFDSDGYDSDAGGMAL